MIFMPPRHGKSELVTVPYAGWRLWNDPKMRVIVSSYNQKLADKFSRSIRRLLSDEEDRLSEPPASAGGRNSSQLKVVSDEAAASITSDVSNKADQPQCTAPPAYAGGSALGGRAGCFAPANLV